MRPILAVVPYTGSERLVEMTARMLESLQHTTTGLPITVATVANAPSRRLTKDELRGAIELPLMTNVGFGPGINAALPAWEHDVLCLNNDLTFTQQTWLRLILDERALDVRDNLHFVYSPRTDRTATREACKDGPSNKPAQRVGQVSAFCWFVPAEVRARLRERSGCQLFPPQFPNAGSDDAAAAWIRKLFGKTPFSIVHRAFVHHEKAQTSNELGVKYGDPKVLKELTKWKRANGLT